MLLVLPGGLGALVIRVRDELSGRMYRRARKKEDVS